MKSLYGWLGLSLLVHLFFIFMMQMDFNFDQNHPLELSLLKKSRSESAKASAANTKSSSPRHSISSPTQTTSSHEVQTGKIGEEALINRNSIDGQQRLLGEDVGIQVQYPKASRVLGETGEVQVGLQKNSQGQIEDVFIRRSSGSKNLDEAALKSVKANLNQEKIQSLWPQGNTMILTFIFQLTESSR